MSPPLRYVAKAAHALLDAKKLHAIEPRLLAARDEMFADVRLLESRAPIPAAKEPLDAGFIDLPAQLLAEHKADPAGSLIGRIETAASMLRNEIDRLVLLGIGGSYMGARALFEALCPRYHNELDREARGGVPRIYFEGNNLDNDAAAALLELLNSGESNRANPLERWGIVVISKSGGTLETAVAFRLFRKALEDFYGADSDESRRLVIPVTGEQGKLRSLAQVKGYENVFPIPDNVGGRFSVFTAVGLLPAAALGLDVRQLLQGAADMTERFRNEPPGSNPVLDYTATGHLFEVEQGTHIRILSTWGSRLEALGLWYDQLLAESLGKQERGATPITVVNTRDLHSRGQQHQEGARDKLITNVIVESPSSPSLGIPESALDQDGFNRLAGKSMPELMAAAIAGTNRAYADAGRPTADIVLPTLSEHTVGQLLQMLMLATVFEGRLIGINPYGQPGVEAYKKNMTDILNRG
ncbi:MAG: glucose-6-phosphate isomerase [Planctomycetaceae bacterium]